jgi:CRP/FNR family cyclic AMP-dependent transcriptional regulator
VDEAVLETIDAETRAAVLSSGTLRRYQKGSWLFHEGDPARKVWAVTVGTVKVQKVSEAGRLSVLGFRSAGCLLGEQSALDGEPMIASAAAFTDVEAVVITAAKFMELLSDSPTLATALLQQLNRRLRQTSRLLQDISTGDAVTRVANRLVDLNTESTSAVRTAAKLPVSQQDLADWAGLSREAVVRSLRTLRDEGIIETGRLSVTVLDPDALAGRGRLHL